MSKEISNGGIRELWRISAPLMISFLSMTTMMFVDRLFIARYSVLGLNAAVEAGTFAWAFTFSFEHLAAITTAFVARLNGAKKLSTIGQPVWQMVYFCLVVTAVFVALGVWGAPVFFAGSSMKISYFRWMMFISPSFSFLAAVGAFFIGRGETRIITILSIVGNLINVVLDPILIFGWNGTVPLSGWHVVIPELGLAGAAIATGIGVMVQVIVLALMMVRSDNRTRYGAMEWKFRPRLLIDMLWTGLPSATALLFEISGWGIFYSLMSMKSEAHILVGSVGQSIVILFFFYGLGLEQGATAVAGNLIGSGRRSEVWRLFQSGLVLIGVFSTVLFGAVLLAGDQLVDLFFSRPEIFEGMIVSEAVVGADELRSLLVSSLIAMAAYTCLDKVRMLICGILRAAGDTLFLMISNALAIWTLMLLPTYLAVHVWDIPLLWLTSLWVFYEIGAVTIVYLRLKSGLWQGKEIFSECH